MRNFLAGLFIILQAKYSVSQSPEVGGALGALSGNMYAFGPTQGKGLCALPAGFSLVARRGTGFPV